MKPQDILVLTKVLLLLLLWTGTGICIAGHWRYKWRSVGACGDPSLVANIASSVQCAAVCSSDARCLGYTLRSRIIPNAACELTEKLSSETKDLVGNCFVKDGLKTSTSEITSTESTPSTLMTTTTITTASTTTTATNTTASTTTTATNTTASTTTTATNTTASATTTATNTTASTTSLTTTPNIIKELASNVPIDGGTGIRAIGFSADTYTFLDVLLPTSLGPADAFVLDIVKSTVVDNLGEICPENDQVLVGYGELDTSDQEKQDQRLYCSSLFPPHKLTSNCTTVRLGEGDHPNFENVDTSSWLNWLVCPEGAMMTGISWSYMKGDTMTNYGYSSASCCLAETQLSA